MQADKYSVHLHYQRNTLMIRIQVTKYFHKHQVFVPQLLASWKGRAPFLVMPTEVLGFIRIGLFRSEIPSLQDLMPDDLRWG